MFIFPESVCLVFIHPSIHLTGFAVSLNITGLGAYAAFKIRISTPPIFEMAKSARFLQSSSLPKSAKMEYTSGVTCLHAATVDSSSSALRAVINNLLYVYVKE